MDTKTIEAVMKTVTIDTKIDGGKVEAVIGERARMEVERAVCYIKSGKAEIDAAVDARLHEIDTEGQEYVDLAKDWAIKTDGTVDGVDYSSKYYAQSILPIASDITTVAGISSDVSTTAGIASDISSVAGNATDISAVAGDIANINTVAGDISNVNAVAGDLSNIDAVNSNKTNIDTVAGVSSDVTTVAGISSDVTAVAGNSSDISTVSGISSDVSTVAGDISNINAVAGDLTNIDNASGYAAQAKQYAIGDPTEPTGNSAKYWAEQSASAAATVNDGTLTIQKNGVDVQTFTANASTNATANITVPTDTADLTNGAGYITGVDWGDIGGTLSDQTDLQSALNTKQDLLTSANAGTDISITEGSIIESTTESGTGSVTLASAKANGLSSVKLSGALTRSATPTPASPASFTCNNGVIGVSGGSIITTGTAETVEDELGNTATAERLLSFDSDHTDVQEILTGAVTRKVGIKVLDGTETTSWTVQSNRAYALKSTLGMSDCLQPTGTGINSLLNSHFSNNTINSYGNVLFNYTMSNIGVSDVTSWNNWLATQYANGTPVIVIYPLNAGATESVTAQTLTTQLGTNVLDITQSSIADLLIEATYDKIIGTTSAIISFSNNSGYITGITSGDVTTALGYTPYDATNPNGYITGITSGDVTTALGYTPYNSTNPSGYISSASISSLTDVTLSSLANGEVLIYNSTSQKWENGTISGVTVDQTYDGTSSNAQSGVAMAGELANYVTTNTAQSITDVKTFVQPDGNDLVKIQLTEIERNSPSSDIYRVGIRLTDVNSDSLGAVGFAQLSSGRLMTRLQAWSPDGSDSYTIWVGYNGDGTVRTGAPACAEQNSILTTAGLSTAGTYTRLQLGNGVKIASAYISGISGSSAYTWNYGITFTETPQVLVTRRSTSTATTGIYVWVRGTPGTSSCEIYNTGNSGNTYNFHIMAVGH